MPDLYLQAQRAAKRWISRGLGDPRALAVNPQHPSNLRLPLLPWPEHQPLDATLAQRQQALAVVLETFGREVLAAEIPVPHDDRDRFTDPADPVADLVALHPAAADAIHAAYRRGLQTTTTTPPWLPPADRAQRPSRFTIFAGVCRINGQAERAYGIIDETQGRVVLEGMLDEDLRWLAYCFAWYACDYLHDPITEAWRREAYGRVLAEINRTLDPVQQALEYLRSHLAPTVPAPPPVEGEATSPPAAPGAPLPPPVYSKGAADGGPAR